MNILEHMMKLYEEALEELMDAQKYTKCYEHTEHMDDKSMYRTLARQELEHEAMIVKAGDRLFSGADASDSLHMVWHHLKKHLHDWRSSLEVRLADK
jgi:precorrin-6B methylase 1